MLCIGRDDEDILKPHEKYIAMLEAMENAEGPTLSQMSVPEARAMFRAMQPDRGDLVVESVSDVSIEVTGSSVAARVYNPQPSERLPIVVFFHGGGWVIGDLDTHDGICRELCMNVPATVVAVDYRLAPEHKFPTAAEDCYAALQWIDANRNTLGGGDLPLAVAGDSAGGNLAAVVCQMSRDRSGPEICFQLLVYPVTDGTSFETESYRSCSTGYMLTTESMQWFWDHYADHADRNHPYASPLKAESLTGLPSALVMVAGFDPLRSEGEAYGTALAEAGVNTQVVCYDDFIHGFLSHTATVPETQTAMNQACESLRRVFAT